MTTTTLRPFFSYYGGKWRDAVKNYPTPKYDTIVEPFAGSCGYSLQYYRSNVIICDADPVISGLWKYLIGVKPSEIMALPFLQDGETVDDLNVIQEAKWLIGFWLNAGSSGPCKVPSSWMRQGLNPKSYWGNDRRNRVASQVEHIRHWKVVDGTYLNCPDTYATWFIDPPYMHAGKHYKHGSSKIDYTNLANWCMSRKGQTIVCENYGADWLPFSSLKNVKTTRKGKLSHEAVWLNNSE